MLKRAVWLIILGLSAGALSCATAADTNAPTSGAQPRVVAEFTEFVGSIPAGWTNHAPRPEISPSFSVDTKAGRTSDGALRIDSTDPAQFGHWQRQLTGFRPGQEYRFIAHYRTKDISNPQRCVIARLEWLDGAGKSLRPPEYAAEAGSDSGWTRMQYTSPAPAGAARLDVQLALGFTRGSLWWDDIRVEETASGTQRVVRALTVFHRPRGTRSAQESVEQFCVLVAREASKDVDLVCLPEGITVVGNGKSYAEMSEPVPGQTTERLGKLAKELKSYIVAGLYERSGSLVYNTAVLIDRQGKLVGSYRKTHLPREEWESGITPGDSYPVFDTDFGKVGLIICWDVQFPEPARAMALQGAEILLLPIWGGSDVLARARAIENHVFLVSATYDMRSFMVDPAGHVLAEATKMKPCAIAELRLDEPIYQPWLGNMKTRTWKERRGDIALP